MNFTEYEQHLLDTKPKFLTDEDKRIRVNCKAKIKYNKNKDKILENRKEYYQTNKEEIQEKSKEYYQKYYKTPECYKAYKKSSWKRFGLNMGNFEEIFNRYINTTLCDYCCITLTIDKKSTKTTRCMDHCHITGKFRAVLCHSCNVKKVTDI